MAGDPRYWLEIKMVASYINLLKIVHFVWNLPQSTYWGRYKRVCRTTVLGFQWATSDAAHGAVYGFVIQWNHFACLLLIHFFPSILDTWRVADNKHIKDFGVAPHIQLVMLNSLLLWSSHLIRSRGMCGSWDAISSWVLASIILDTFYGALSPGVQYNGHN